jgi:hypothetical protein
MDTPEHDPHRPLHITDMAGAAEWTPLQLLLTRPDPPHILLSGGSGSGKSCALRLLLGSAIGFWLQCSHDPTLRDNRERIKLAARRRVPDGVKNWIVLEHADLLHADAQAFLRRIIETSVGGTRFILEARDVSAIAEPLLSRTVILKAPVLLEHEIRAEVERRIPTISRARAQEVAHQSVYSGNIRWAILQALGSGDSLVAPSLLLSEPVSWSSVLDFMETVQQTGSSPRHSLEGYGVQSSPVWERPGGVCPWSLLALALSKRV